MHSPHAVLLYGHEQMLQATRRTIFERAGFQALEASDSGELRGAVSHQRCELLVLCHTLSPQEALEAIEESRQRSRAVQVLLLMDSGFPSAAEIPADWTINALDGPEALLAAARRLLQAEMEPSAARSLQVQ
jgi:DNA-binding response OmpR family regulator